MAIKCAVMGSLIIYLPLALLNECEGQVYIFTPLLEANIFLPLNTLKDAWRRGGWLHIEDCEFISKYILSNDSKVCFFIIY